MWCQSLDFSDVLFKIVPFFHAPACVANLKKRVNGSETGKSLLGHQRSQPEFWIKCRIWFCPIWYPSNAIIRYVKGYNRAALLFHDLFWNSKAFCWMQMWDMWRSTHPHSAWPWVMLWLLWILRLHYDYPWNNRPCDEDPGSTADAIQIIL